MTPGADWHPDDYFLDRVKRAYRHAVSVDGRTPLLSLWRPIGQLQADIHDALMESNNDRLRAIFKNPASTDLFYGVDNLCRSVPNLDGSNLEIAAAALFKDAGLSDGQFSFPNPFPGEYGFQTSRGVASYRAILSAHQALQIAKLTNGSVIEIGPGLGRVALHAKQIGIISYTTVDLPMGIVAQACFLGAAIGPDAIWFPTDPESPIGRIRLMTFHDVRKEPRRYSLALNADSIVEMDHWTAAKYALWIRKKADVFLSINNDYKRMKVGHLAFLFFRGAKSMVDNYRLRQGYKTAIYRF